MSRQPGAGYYEAGITNAQLAVAAAERKLAGAINEALDNGVTAERAATLLGISRATLYRRFRWVQQQLGR